MAGDTAHGLLRMRSTAIESKLLLYALAVQQAEWFHNPMNPLYNGPWHRLVNAMRFDDFTPDSSERLLGCLQKGEDFDEAGFSVSVEKDQVCFPPDPPQIPKVCFAVEPFVQSLQHLHLNYQDAISRNVTIYRGLLGATGSSESAQRTQLQIIAQSQQMPDSQAQKCWDFFLKFAPRLDVDTVETLLADFDSADKGNYWYGTMADEELNLTREEDAMRVSSLGEECACSYSLFRSALEQLLLSYLNSS